MLASLITLTLQLIAVITPMTLIGYIIGLLLKEVLEWATDPKQ